MPRPIHVGSAAAPALGPTDVALPKRPIPRRQRTHDRPRRDHFYRDPLRPGLWRSMTFRRDYTEIVSPETSAVPLLSCRGQRMKVPSGRESSLAL